MKPDGAAPEASPSGVHMLSAAMLLVSASAYGFNIPFARTAAQLGVPGADLLAARVALIMILLALIAAIGRISLKVASKDRAPLACLGLTTSIIGLCYLSSVAFIPVAVAVMIFYTFPLLILVASPIVDGTRLTRGRLLAFALAFSGIVLVIGSTFDSLDWRGLTLASVASVGAAVQFFFASRAPGGGGLTTVFWVHVVILPVALIASMVAGGPVAITTLKGAFAPIALNIAGYAVGFFLQIRGMRGANPAAAGLIFCLEPIVATLSAAVLISERLSLTQYAGGGLVLTGIVFSIALDHFRTMPRPEAA